MLKSKIQKLQAKAVVQLQEVIKNEKGDTNFISILIILGIVIILAGVFMVFKDQIIGQVQEIIDGFTIH